MTRISANELLSRLEKGKAIPAILLLGEEPYLRDRCRALLMERYVPDAARPWAVSRYSADRRETQAALEQAQTMAMLSPVQLVFLEDAEATYATELREGFIDHFSRDDMRVLGELLARLAPSSSRS